jgi:hypothetical protein
MDPEAPERDGRDVGRQPLASGALEDAFDELLADIGALEEKLADLRRVQEQADFQRAFLL